MDVSPDSPIFQFVGNGPSLLALAAAAASSARTSAIRDDVLLLAATFTGLQSARSIRAEISVVDGSIILREGGSSAATLLSCALGGSPASTSPPAKVPIRAHATGKTHAPSRIRHVAIAHASAAFPAPPLASSLVDGVDLAPVCLRAVAAHLAAADARFDDADARSSTRVFGDATECAAMDPITGARVQTYTGMVTDGFRSSSSSAAAATETPAKTPRGSGTSTLPLYAMSWEATSATRATTTPPIRSGPVSNLRRVDRSRNHPDGFPIGRVSSVAARVAELSQAVVAAGRFAPAAATLTVASSASTAPAVGPTPDRRGVFAGGDAETAARDGAVWGALRVLASEARTVRFGGVDVDAASADGRRVASPVTAAVAVRRGAALVGTLARAPVLEEKAHTPRPGDGEGRYHSASRAPPAVITGGLGGLGRLVAGWIARGGDDTTIVLLGRTGRAAVSSRDALAAGGVMIAARCDAASAEDAAFAAFAAGRRVGSFLHAGGVLRDAAIPNQTAGGVARVVAPKLPGLVRAHDAATAFVATDSRVVFSSVAATLGSAGQANYAAANAAADAWAADQRARGLAGVISVQWGAWSGLELQGGGGGMASEDARTLTRLTRLGVGALDPETGLAALRAAMVASRVASPANVVANPFDWKVFLRHLPSPTPRMFARVAAEAGLSVDVVDERTDTFEASSSSSDAGGVSTAGLARGDRIAAIRDTIASTVDRVLGHAIDPDKPLIDAGVDSLSMAELGRAIESDVGVALPATVAFDYPTVAAIAEYAFDQLGDSETRRADSDDANVRVTRHLNANANANANASPHRSDVAAVVGVGARFPGVDGEDCDSASKFWSLVASGGDAIAVVPPDRWDVDTNTRALGLRRRLDPETEKYSRHGSFVRDVDLFDCAYFGMDASEAAAVDPQQRAILKVTADAMHTGGLSARAARGTNTAVYVGICNNDHDAVLRERVVEMSLEGKSYEDVVDVVGSIAYSTYAFASNRASHVLGLVGASLSVDCASASGLVVVHMGATEAKRGRGSGLRCVSASVNLILHHNLTDLHTARDMFPSDGRCKTFDAAADGFERGEGAGAVMFRNAAEVNAARATPEEAASLARARDASDESPEPERVLAFVRGSATVHKGGGASLRALRGPAIQHKVRAALADADMTPREVKYVEASGLGEPFGDAVELGAYQAVFGPGRDDADPVVFGSVHTNVGHLDGCSGMASFVKACLVAQHATAPPIVHFKSLHPLMRGRSGGETATAMGHTWRDVDAGRFPSAFPMGKAPMFSAANASVDALDAGRPTCAVGVSSFGFGGTMAHVVVDAAGADVSRPAHRPLAFAAARTLPRPDRSARDRAQELSEETLAVVENVVWQALRATVGPARVVTRGGDLFDPDGAALTDAEASETESRLRERLGADESTVPRGVLAANPGVAKLAEATLRAMVARQASAGLNVGSVMASWIASQTRRHRVEPERLPSSLALAPPAKNPRRMIFVLANPRSGSTLTQLILNANPALFAPQELYLLHFYTMAERRRRLAGQELEGWIFEGLRKAVMELRECDAAAADATLRELDALDTQQVYDVLQGWAGERVLVDKTPPYVWSADTLRRAEEMFEDVRYVFVHRHPLSNVASMAKETIRREWLSGALDGIMGTGDDSNSNAGVGSGASVSDARLAARRRAKAETQTAVETALWTEAERLWALGNANALEFLRDVPPDRALVLSYENLVTDTIASARALCEVAGVPYREEMADPYAERNAATFAPAAEGGLGAGDPNMLARRGVDPALADAWRRASPPAALSPFAAHVAARLGYRLPPWKEPIARAGGAPELVRLNRRVEPPVVIFAHGVSGEADAARPLAEALPFAAFGLRVVERRDEEDEEDEEDEGDRRGEEDVGDEDDEFGGGSGSFLSDESLAASAERYRRIANDALGLGAGDTVVFVGAGALGGALAREMAARQREAARADAERARVRIRSWASGDGEPEALGAVVLDEDEDEDDDDAAVDETFAPAEIRALLAVARDERARRREVRDPSAEDRNDAVAVDDESASGSGPDSASALASPSRPSAFESFAAFVARLRDAGGFDSADATLDAAATFSDASTPREEWDARVHRALRVAARAETLLAAYHPPSNGDGTMLVVSTRAVKGEASEEDAAEERSARTETRHARRSRRGDALAPERAEELAALVVEAMRGPRA